MGFVGGWISDIVEYVDRISTLKLKAILKNRAALDPKLVGRSLVKG
jgi:hypothetical protein